MAILSPNFWKPIKFKYVGTGPNCAHDDAAREQAARARVSAAKCELVAEVARNFGEVRMRVMGLSMFPCLLPGDIVTVERRAIEDFQPGEIAKYFRDGRLMVHRVIELRDGKLITRGDAAMENDPPVCADGVVGKVVSVTRGGERFEPRMAPTWRERTMARMARHSSLAARFLFLTINFTATLSMITRRRATPTEQAASCQN